MLETCTIRRQRASGLWNQEGVCVCSCSQGSLMSQIIFFIIWVGISYFCPHQLCPNRERGVRVTPLPSGGRAWLCLEKGGGEGSYSFLCWGMASGDTGQRGCRAPNPLGMWSCGDISLERGALRSAPPSPPASPNQLQRPEEGALSMQIIRQQMFAEGQPGPSSVSGLEMREPWSPPSVWGHVSL